MAESSLRGLMIFRPFFQKLRKGFGVVSGGSRARETHALGNHNAKFEEDMSVGKAVPHDVKEGSFAVCAAKGKETKRFVINIDHLTNPELLSLMDQGREEYGSHQTGVLSLPCNSHELQEILQHTKLNDAAADPDQTWAACNATVLETNN